MSKSKGGFDAYAMEQGDGQDGQSHGSWSALPTVLTMLGVKRAAPSKSPKKVDTKMARQMQMQQQVQQQARHLVLTYVYLPSALVGMKHYQTSKKNINALSQEQEHLGREARAAQVLYTSTGVLGQPQMVLTQPTQVSGIIELPVPWIQLSELCLRNAGTMLKDQVMAQNLIFFGERVQMKGAAWRQRSECTGRHSQQICATAHSIHW